MPPDAAVILNANGEICVIIVDDEVCAVTGRNEGNDPAKHERIIAHVWSETKPGHALARVPKAQLLATLQAANSTLALLKVCVPAIQDAQAVVTIQAKIDAADAEIASKAAQAIIDQAAFVELIAKYEKETGKILDPNDMDSFDAWVEASKPIVEPAP